MGLLGDVIKKGLEETIGEDATKGLANAFSEAMDALEKGAENYEKNNPSSTAGSGGSVQRAENAQGSEIADTATAEYFEDLITKNIPDVEVKKYVSVAEVAAAADKAVNIDVLVLKGGKPAVAILIVPKNSYKSLAVRNTMEACEKSGIKPLRFFREFSNEAGYVVGRIQAAL